MTMNNNLLNNRFILATALFLLMTGTGCSVFRPGTTSGGSENSPPSQPSPDKKGSGDTRFLNTISTDNTDAPEESGTGGTAALTPGAGRKDRNRSAGSPLYRTKERNAGNKEKTTATAEKTRMGSTASLSVLQLKYSMLTNTPVEKLDNQKLLEFMDEWYGVPYRFGGTTKKGIDCSAFTLTLMADVYGVTSIPRMSKDQYAASEKISRKKLREGDLVFFHTYGKGKTVTHVGVYLYNNRFVHASVSGVQIDDLEGSYYSRHFVGAGRILE